MKGRRKILIAIAGVTTAGIVAALAIRGVAHQRVNTIAGVVLREDPNIRNQVPIARAEIRSGDLIAKSDSSGLFHLNLRPERRLGETVAVKISHPEYETQETAITVNGELYILHLTPVPVKPPPAQPVVTVSNPRVRYAVTETTKVNVGSAAETFEVVNEGNLACRELIPCSPDGKWKATISGKSLDAGNGNSFEDARVTCIAGPCPFTRIEKDSFTAGGR